MADRLSLHEVLCEIINMREPNGDRHVYYNSPSSVMMKYPAIRYSLQSIDVLHADDTAYKQDNSYEIILITEDPDSEYITKLMALPMCRFVRFYRADNLNHYVFTLYY